MQSETMQNNIQNYNDSDALIRMEHEKFMAELKERERKNREASKDATYTERNIPEEFITNPGETSGKGRFSMKRKPLVQEVCDDRRPVYSADNDYYVVRPEHIVRMGRWKSFWYHLMNK